MFKLDAIRQGGTVITAMWQQEERLQALNNGYSEVCKLVRRNRKDHFTRRRLSTDGVVNIRGIDYDCASLQIRAGVATYTMPPDFLEIRAIRPLATDRTYITFELRDEADEDFRQARRSPTSPPANIAFYYGAVTGERTITLAPNPQETLETEFSYVAQMEPLRLYTTGTITPTNGSTAVLVAGGDWRERISGIRIGDEVLVGSTASNVTGVAMNNATLTVRYQKIGTVSAAGTDAGLMDAYLGSTAGSLFYTVASVPQFHDDWHYGIASYAVFDLLKPIEQGAEAAKAAAKAEWDAVSSVLIPESAHRQSQNPELAEDGWSSFE